jgi:hypothetical protein
MKIRASHIAILLIAIFVIFIAFLMVDTSPPGKSNEIFVTVGHNDWEVGSDQIIYGETIWGVFADYQYDEGTNRRETIRVDYCIYWGGVQMYKEHMSWENETGNYLSKSLGLNDLILKWQDSESESVFKFKHEDKYYRVAFSIPKLENGIDKYSNLTDAWENGELYQITDEW